MDEELQSHIQHRADDLARSGLDRAEAERRARIEFGGHQRFEEECQEALGGNFIESLIRDLRFSFRVAVRGLARSLHSKFGFEPRNAMLVNTHLSMAG